MEIRVSRCANSGGGVRVIKRLGVKSPLDITLWDWDQTLVIKAKVIWDRRLGFLRREIGLEFIDIPPELAQRLTLISINHRLRRVI